MQVVRVFKEENGMQRFRNWVMNPDEGEMREAAQPKPKRGSKRDAGNNIPDAAVAGVCRVTTCCVMCVMTL